MLCLVLTGTHLKAQEESKSASQMLHYNRPATQWEETLPLGNGRLGMMPDGGIDREHIVLNEISMWSGMEADYSNPEAARCLPAIQQLLFDGKNKEAQEMMYRNFVPRKPEKGGTYGSFQVLGELNIDYLYETSPNWQGPLMGNHAQWGGNYSRYLDLTESVAYTILFSEGKKYERNYFVSRDRDVILIRLRCTQPGSINFRVGIDRKGERSVTLTDGRLKLAGVLDSGKEGTDGVKYAAYVDVQCSGKDALRGNEGKTIAVQRADEAWIIISAATSYLEGDGYDRKAKELLHQVTNGSFEGLQEEAVRSYQKLYNRANLSIKGDERTESLPTNERIALFQQKDDPSLAALYYNYGRYLLISSTRPGSLPPNLQGLWANTIETPWNGDYHTNINVQMNHWPVEQGNLSELHLPLIELTKGLVASGEQTAKAFYGEHAKGWVAHMMTNVWHYTAPGEHPSWGATNTGGAWLCAHLWEHYLYTGDKTYLKEIYPVLKGASEFFLSTMVKEPTHGWLVTAPTSSPENSFYIGNDPTAISVCMGPTMDTQLIYELYNNVIQAAGTLGIDNGYSRQLAAAIKKLPPHQISKEGYLMEWLEDYKETDIHHRHVSHLYGLHPGNQISLTHTPELAAACRQTLERRGDGGTGWSRAWKINFWARLGDGNRAYKLFKSLLTPAYTDANPLKHGSGTFPNLFCSHSPFQIDGNWGGTAGISEMLLQSQDGVINPLPALPDSWKEGQLKGFKVRGGAAVDLCWQDGKTSKISITADYANRFRVKIPAEASVITVKQGKRTSTLKGKEYIDLNLKKGEKVVITCQ